jgi:general secretion pathway protein D
VFSGSTGTISTSLNGDYGRSATRAGGRLRGAALLKPAQSLAKLATPGPALQVKPNESIVQSGKEVTIAIVDGRLRTSDENTFRFEYDPDILEFKHLDDGQLITAGATKLEGDGNREGTVMFQFTHPDQRAPRTVNLTFVAKSPGVSPVRVELRHSGTVDEASFEAIGSGVVRVR